MANMLAAWPMLLGWPAILAAIALSVMGIVRRRPAWLVVAAVLAAPFALYVAASPRFGWLGLSIPLLLAGASIAIHYQHSVIAWSLLAPFLGISAWLAKVVFY